MHIGSQQNRSDLNTSHVLIYPGDTIPAGKSLEFKYISCSYLSTGKAQCQLGYGEFKYISCSYLSYSSSG